MLDMKKHLSGFQIIGHVTKSIKLKNDFIGFEDDAKLNRSIQADYTVSDLYTNEDDSCIIGSILLHVKCEVKESAKKKLVCETVTEGLFTAPKDIGQEQFEKMLGLNGCSTLYSITRALIVSLTSQSLGYGKVVLPMINFFKLNESKKAKNDNADA